MRTVIETNQETIEAELESTRVEFHRILDNMSGKDWRRPSRNKAWTNGQVLFHMTFGFIIVPPLFRLIRFFSRIPKIYSRIFISILNFGTSIFNVINALGPRFGARAFGSKSLGRKFDRVHAAVLKKLESVKDDEWDKGMYYPSRWDPQMNRYMTFEKLFRYPIIHFRHHAEQITHQ